MRLVTAVLMGVAAGAASAAPPPPPVYPADFPKTLEGYDLTKLYGPYSQWMSRGREEALRQSLDDPGGKWKNKSWWSTPATSRLVDYDFGVVRVDRLALYCEGRRWNEEKAGPCEHRYTYASIPDDPWRRDAIEGAVKSSFRPEALVKLLAQRGIGPEATNYWGGRADAVFADHFDRTALFLPWVEKYEVAASECPKLKMAIAALGKVTLDMASPMAGKALSEVLPPHSRWTEVEISGAVQDGSEVIVKGTRPLYRYMEPLWAAVENCSPAGFAKPTI